MKVTDKSVSVRGPNRARIWSSKTNSEIVFSFILAPFNNALHGIHPRLTVLLATPLAAIGYRSGESTSIHDSITSIEGIEDLSKGDSDELNGGLRASLSASLD